MGRWGTCLCEQSWGCMLEVSLEGMNLPQGLCSLGVSGSCSEPLGSIPTQAPVHQLWGFGSPAALSPGQSTRLESELEGRGDVGEAADGRLEAQSLWWGGTLQGEILQDGGEEEEDFGSGQAFSEANSLP